jgi:hypothetical protein
VIENEQPDSDIRRTDARGEDSSTAKLSQVLLLAGDLVCFLIFAVLGLRSHEDGITADGILRAAVPFQVSWAVVSTLLRGQPGVGEIAKPRNVIRVWIPALVIGLVIRSLVFGRDFAPTFAVVAFLVNGLLLVLWRCVLAPVVVRR